MQVQDPKNFLKWLLEDLFSALAGQYGASATTTAKKQWPG